MYNVSFTGMTSGIILQHLCTYHVQIALLIQNLCMPLWYVSRLSNLIHTLRPACKPPPIQTQHITPDSHAHQRGHNSRTLNTPRTRINKFEIKKLRPWISDFLANFVKNFQGLGLEPPPIWKNWRNWTLEQNNTEKHLGTEPAAGAEKKKSIEGPGQQQIRNKNDKIKKTSDENGPRLNKQIDFWKEEKQLRVQSMKKTGLKIPLRN